MMRDLCLASWQESLIFGLLKTCKSSRRKEGFPVFIYAVGAFF